MLYLLDLHVSIWVKLFVLDLFPDNVHAYI